jgi:hypothetical protein
MDEDEIRNHFYKVASVGAEQALTGIIANLQKGDPSLSYADAFDKAVGTPEGRSLYKSYVLGVRRRADGNLGPGWKE